MISTPKISIIVPVYNTEKILSHCIESILRQTFTKYELLLVDDGSTDNSGAICEEYALKDDRIKVFHILNGGVSSARNKGLDEAKGEWIAFADSDDTVEKEWLATFINNSTNVDWVVQGFKKIYNASIVYEENEKRITAGIEDSSGTNLNSIKEFVYNLVNEEILGYLWCKMFRKDIIEKHHLRFNTLFKIREDEDFIFKYINYIRSYRNVANGHYNYNYPHFSSKYIIEKKCVMSIWLSAKQFYEFNKKLPFIAQIYGNLYLVSLVKVYQQEKSSQNERISNLLYYLNEFGDYEILLKNKSSKIISFFLFRKNLRASDFIYNLIFKTVKLLKFK